MEVISLSKADQKSMVTLLQIIVWARPDIIHWPVALQRGS